MTRKITYAALAATTLAGLAISAAPAQAAQERPAGNHCVADISDRTGASMSCFTSEAGAQRAIDGRRGWIPLVIFYDGTGYGGKSLTLGHANGACTASTGNVDYAHPNLGAYGWNNRASSFVTRNRCDMKGYDGTSYTGDSFKSWVDHDSRLVRWNNDISSFRLS